MSARVSHVGGVTLETVLEDVETLDLLLTGDPQADRGLEGGEEDAGADDHPDEDDGGHQQLDEQLVDTAAVEQAGIFTAEEGVVVGGEQADRDQAPEAADAVDADGAHRIVDLDLVEEQHRTDDQYCRRWRRSTPTPEG